MATSATGPAVRELAPASVEDLAHSLREANDAELAVALTSGCTKLDWGQPLRRCDRVISMRGLDRVLEHAAGDMTVSVEAGCRISQLQERLAQHRQRLALDPLWPERATVGGVLATNDSGVLRLRYGSARDLLIGVTLVLADGTIAKSGGKVVKNVAGYDLPKLVVGAFGTLGAVAQAVFRLHPLPEQRCSLALDFTSYDAAQAFVLSVQAAPLAHAALQIRVQGTGACSVEILLEGTRPGIEAQTASIQRIAARALSPADESVWQARARLWDGAELEPGAAPSELPAVLKLSVLPSDLARTWRALDAVAGGSACSVFQATGLGFARLMLDDQQLAALRRDVEARAGSLVILRRSAALHSSDVFGTVRGLRIMRALKRQFDPKHMLNPGRFVAEP